MLYGAFTTPNTSAAAAALALIKFCIGLSKSFGFQEDAGLERTMN